MTITALLKSFSQWSSCVHFNFHLKYIYSSNTKTYTVHQASIKEKEVSQFWFSLFEAAPAPLTMGHFGYDSGDHYYSALQSVISGSQDHFVILICNVKNVCGWARLAYTQWQIFSREK